MMHSLEKIYENKVYQYLIQETRQGIISFLVSISSQA